MCPLKNIFIFQFGVTDELRGQIVVYLYGFYYTHYNTNKYDMLETINKLDEIKNNVKVTF